jgi:hypothetical protein
MQEAGLPAPAEISAAFEEVLREPEFQYADSSPLLSWIATIRDALLDLLGRWWPELGDAQLRLISWLALAAAVSVLVVLVTRWASRGYRAHSGGSGESAPRPRDAHGWAAAARASAAAGRYREAATGVYQATILHLDSVGSVRYGEWKTPGDYALEVSGDGDLRLRLTDFLSAFVELAFGPREPGSSDFEALSLRAARLGSRV